MNKGDLRIDPQRKILRYPEILARMQAGLRAWPINIELDMSNQCNLKCAHCDFAHTHNSQEMSPELASQVLNELAAGGTRAITLTGGGEPTLNADFAAIARHAAALDLRLGLYTNGVDVSRLIPALDKFAWVYISLDEASQESYKIQKGADRFNQVTRNIKALVGEESKPTIGVGFMIHPSNMNQIPEMVSLKDQLGVDYIQFHPTVGLTDYSWVRGIRHLLRHLQQQENIHVVLQRFHDLGMNQHGKHERGYTVCRGSELVPCIGASGEVWVCPNTRGLRKLGDLSQESFKQVWLRRPEQYVGTDCRVACRNHFLNQTLEYVCSHGIHEEFV